MFGILVSRWFLVTDPTCSRARFDERSMEVAITVSTVSDFADATTRKHRLRENVEDNMAVTSQGNKGISKARRTPADGPRAVGSGDVYNATPNQHTTAKEEC